MEILFLKWIFLHDWFDKLLVILRGARCCKTSCFSLLGEILRWKQKFVQTCWYRATKQWDDIVWIMNSAVLMLLTSVVLFLVFQCLKTVGFFFRRLCRPLCIVDSFRNQILLLRCLFLTSGQILLMHEMCIKWK